MSSLELKIPPPAVALAMALAMWGLASDADPTLPGALRWAAALVFIAAGAAASFAGVIAFRRARTTVNPLRPEKTSALVSSGIYRFTRNPMYLGFLLILLGWGCYLGSGASLLGPPVFVLYMNRFQIVPEERALAAMFGGRYTSYCARVRRWL